MIHKWFFNTNKLSASHNWLLHHTYIKNIKEKSGFVKGTVLNIGCGKKPYEKILSKDVDMYVGLEHSSTLHGLSKVDVLGSSLFLPFKNGAFDSIVSFQVMEHIPEPSKMLDESRRVLKRGGFFLITTPFMWGEHESPHDYFRYTRYGLKHLAENAGFEVVSISPDTKYWTTAALRFNYYLIRFARGPIKKIIEIIFYPIFFLNQLAAYWLDKLPHNYTVDTASFTTLLKKPD